MTKDDYLKLIEDPSNSRSTLQGMADALAKIFNAKSPGGGGGQMPPMKPGQPQKQEIDPDIPEIAGKQQKGTDDQQYADPDNLIDKVKKIQLEPNEQDQDDQNEKDNNNQKNNQNNNQVSDNEYSGEDEFDGTEDDEQEDDNGKSSNDKSQDSARKSSSNNDDKSSNSDNQNQDGTENETTGDTKDNTKKRGKENTTSNNGSPKSSQSDDSLSDEEIDKIKDSISDEEIKLGNRQKEQVKRAIKLGEAAIKNAIKRGKSEKLIDAVRESIKELSNITEADLYDLSEENKITDKINRAIENISKIAQIHRSDDLEQHGQLVKKANSSAMANLALDSEDKRNIANDRFKNGLDKNIQLFKAANGTDKLKIDLNELIKMQIKNYKEKVRKYDYDIEDDDLGIIRKHNVVVNRDEVKKPSLRIYLDHSGSWTQYRDLADSLVSELKYFVDKDLLTIDIVWFNDHLIFVKPGANQGGSNGAWGSGEIYKDIVKTQPGNVMILTDSDENDDISSTYPKLRLDGGVFFVWKYQGSAGEAPKIMKSLEGALLTEEYYIETNHN